MTKTLILTVGLPRSGKSTWAKQQGYPIVNPDSIRVALYDDVFIGKMEGYVWLFAKTMVESLFLAGHDVVILDATNLTEESREQWKNNAWEIEYRQFRATKDTCIQRAIDSNTHYLIPVIEKMAERMTFPE